MTLGERLKQLDGRKVKVGGAVGFVYCGVNFPELPEVLDDIAKEERAKLKSKLAKATKIYDDREARWEVRKAAVAKDISTLKMTIEDAAATIDRCKRFMEKASRLLDIYRGTALADRTTKLIKIKNKLKRKKDDAILAKSANEKRLKYRETLFQTMQTVEAKERQFEAWKKTRDSYAKEVDSLKSLSGLEVVDEYGSTTERGERILIVDSTIEGPYWYDEECDRDEKMWQRIRRATTRREYKEYLIFD